MRRLLLVLACCAVSVLVLGGIAATGAPPSPKRTTHLLDAGAAGVYESIEVLGQTLERAPLSLS